MFFYSLYTLLPYILFFHKDYWLISVLIFDGILLFVQCLNILCILLCQLFLTKFLLKCFIF